MLYQEYRQKLQEARKNSQNLEKKLLSIILGEADNILARTNKSPDDSQIEKIVRKLIESNKETIGVSNRNEINSLLEEENKFLDTLLPKTLSRDEIKLTLMPIYDSIIMAKNDGVAMGIASKYLKDKKALNTDILAIIKEMRK